MNNVKFMELNNMSYSNAWESKHIKELRDSFRKDHYGYYLAMCVENYGYAEKVRISVEHNDIDGYFKTDCYKSFYTWEEVFKWIAEMKDKYHEHDLLISLQKTLADIQNYNYPNRMIDRENNIEYYKTMYTEDIHEKIEKIERRINHEHMGENDNN